MRNRRIALTALIVSAVLLCGTVSRASSGVAIFPSEVIVGNLAVGASYDLFELGALKWNVQNRGSEAADVTVESVGLEGTRAPDGYEPIPDPAWIIPTSRMIENLGPMDVATISVSIQLPDDDAYAGKKFAGIIEAKNAPRGGTFGIGVAARARILFTVKSAPDKSRPVSNHGLTISTSPYVIDVGTVALGELHKSARSLNISNPNARDVQVRLEQITLDQSLLRTAPDCESLPDGTYLVFENRTVSIPAGETLEIPIYVALPEKEEYSGRKFAVVVHAALSKGGLAVGTYTIVKFDVE